MKTLILYKSQNGATKQYSEWLHEKYPETNIASIEDFDKADLSKYEKIIFGTPTYGGQIVAKAYLEEIWPDIKNKQVYLMVVGMVPMNAKWSNRSFKTISKEIREGLAGYVKLPGQVADKISKVDGFMMRLFLGVNPKDVKQQSKVQKEDLKPVYEWM